MNFQRPQPAQFTWALPGALALTLLVLVACSPQEAPPAEAAPVEPAAVVQPTSGQGATATAAAPQAAETSVPEAQVILPTPTTASPQTAAPFDSAATPLSLTPVASGLDRPTYLTHAGDGSGRLFILEKPGRVRIVENGTLLPTPFLDITDRVGNWGDEQGLLGLAFAPDYAESGRFFVNHINLDGDTVVSGYTVSHDPNLADPTSESLILTIDQPAPNHNGGMITFGPDGMLWIGMGDGGGANDGFGNGQNPATLLGKMLRIDVLNAGDAPYAIPADNPWVSADWNGDDVRDEVWAVGLRNPWRFSFDRTTHDLWIADVGQNLIEEINFVPSDQAGGLNFGWPIQEGTDCFFSDNCDTTDLVQPIAEYRHAPHCSVTGGYVYRGQRSPALQGVYLYSDYCSGFLWALTPTTDGAWASQEVLDTAILVSSFGEDEAGELYVVGYEGSVSLITVGDS